MMTTGSPSDTFWMVALPLKHREKAQNNSALIDEDRSILYSYLKDKLAVSSGVAEVYRFSFPELKIGTLDSLVSAGEDLVKMDATLETIVGRLITSLRNLLNNDLAQVKSSLLVNDATTPDAYVKAFQWNVIKYRTDKTVAEVADTLVQEAQQIDNLLKARLSAYNQAKTAVAAVERKNVGSLMVKDLGPYLKASDFIDAQSEFMQTLLVVVSREDQARWLASYERLAELVVPRSSRLITEEGEHALFTVTIFVKVKETFIKAALAEKFTVREYSFDEGRYHETVKADEAMQADLKAQWSSLVRLLKTNFGELFSAWIHLKVVRLFVESVLQYGLPPQFLAVVLKPLGKDLAKSEKKLRLALCHNLEELQLPGISLVDVTTAIQLASEAPGEGTAEEAELWNALNMGIKDADPFVKIAVKIPSCR